MVEIPTPWTFDRDDRGAPDVTLEGLQDILTFAVALRVQERYGLSVVFDHEQLEYTCSDPLHLITGATANTPAGAIMFWESVREDLEERRRKLTLIDSSEEPT